VSLRVGYLILVASLLVGCGGNAADRGTVAPAGAGSVAPSAAVVSAVPLPTGKAPTRTYQVATRADTYTRDGTRTLRTTTWYPKGTAGKFPVVLFSHGLNGLPEDFRPLLSKWAAAGFVVVAPAYPNTSRNSGKFDIADVLNQPADASFVLTQALAGPLKDIMDPDRLGASGHSAGGITTVGLFTAARDQRLRSAVVLAGAAIGVGSAFSGAAVPLMFVHGDADEVVSYASGKGVFDAAPWPKALFTLPGGDHSSAYMRESNKAYGAVAASTLDFLRYSLYGDTAARGRLAGDAAPAGTLDDKLG
jgi:dienelactone hydrolase